jgi:hypothetical protein
MNYQDRLAKGVLELQKYQSTAGGVIQVEVGHDDDCGVFSNKDCTCIPDIHLKAGDRTWKVGEDGVLYLRTMDS